MRLLACLSLTALVAGAPAVARAQATATPAPAAPPSADPFATPADAAGTPPASAAAPDAVVKDPLEGFNRAMWGLNQGIDKVVLKPAATAYRFVTPRPVRRGIGHVFSNLSEPWSFVNNLLQLKIGRAFNNLGRFVVNTTIGVGGLADHATKLGLKPTPEDFGQTLARYGARSSSYLVLPLLGPSTIRDGIGSGVAFFADPYPYCLKHCTDLHFWERASIQALDVVDTRSQLIDSGADAFLQSSLDPYATARSAYLQRRALEIEDREGGANAAAPPVSLDPTAPSPAATKGATDDPFATPPGDPGPAPAPGFSTDPSAAPPAQPGAAPARPNAGLDAATTPRLAVAWTGGITE